MRSAAALVALLLLVVGGAYFFTVRLPLGAKLNQGLDLKGGTYLVLEAVDDPTSGTVANRDSTKAAIPVLGRRINPTGVKEIQIQQSGDKRIIVEIPGETDLAKAQAIIGTTAQLQFKGPDGSVILTGKDLKKATAVAQTGQGQGPGVSLEFNSDGAKKFAEATQKFLGQPIAIYLDDKEISSPRVESVIADGRGVINGSFTIDSATQLSNLLNGGALPVKLQLKESRVVTATLGADSIHKSVIAGVVGLAAVALFMIVFFGIPGFLADMALVVYVGLVFGAMWAVGATLTLPGIAGIILGIGMAVDANILVFTRVREEIRAGRSLRSGIHSGFNRALITVLDSNVTTFIAGMVLYYMGSGTIRGFAVTLMLSIILSLFTAITVTRLFLNLLVNSSLFSAKTLFFVEAPAKAVPARK